jgi:hypothetical protein
MSHDQTWTSGQVLTAAALNDLTSGRVGYVPVTANQGSITSIADLTSLTVTFTAIASRYYKITGECLALSSTGTDTIALFITDGSNNQIQQRNAIATGTGNVSLHAEAIVTPGAGSITYKLRGSRTGGGTMTMSAGATFPAFILVEDLGSA